MALDIEHLRGWIDRTETIEDRVTLAPLRALTATLDRDDAPQCAGDRVPPCWHWLYDLPIHRQSEIGPFEICGRRMDDKTVKPWARTPDGTMAVDASAALA